MDTRNKVERIVKALAAVMNAVDMYGRSHKMAEDSAETLHKLVADALIDVASITIGVIGDELVFEKHPFYDASVNLKGLVERLKSLGIEKLTFVKGIEKKDILEFAAVITRRSSGEDVEKALSSGRFRHLKIGKIGTPEEEDEDTAFDGKDTGDILSETYRGATDFIKRSSEDIRENKPVDEGWARRIVGGMVGSLLGNRDLLRVLTSIKSHDEETFVHEVNVAILTLMQAEALGIEGEDLNEIGVASLLHDAGKMAVAVDIIQKEDDLSQEERNAMKQHTLNGAKILLETPGVGGLPPVVAFEHHIGHDLSGYPEKVYGKGINLVTMMIAISDRYDALRSNRPRHKGMKPEEVYSRMMERSGKFFHPDLLENFFRIVGIYPPGTLVELDTGELGIVVKENVEDIERPVVEILYDPSGERVPAPYSIDLTEKTGEGSYHKSIVGSVTLPDGTTGDKGCQ